MQIASRESFGNALCEIGAQYEDVVVLDSDLAVATKTELFKKKYPDRHIDCGIAECNMMGVAAGLAVTDMIPFASTFAMFAAGRAYEQIRNSIGYPRLNVKICATHAGISVGEDGATHQCNEDIALMREIPGMLVLCPSDDIETKCAVHELVKYNGPSYLRLSRMPVPVLNNNEDYNFEIGKGITLMDGNDITIIATGIEIHYALEAAKMLKCDDISARVINIHTIKPIDKEIIIKAARETKRLYTVEEHSVIGGLGSCVVEITSDILDVVVYRHGIYDVYGESGSAQDLIRKYELDADGIYKFIKSHLYIL